MHVRGGICETRLAEKSLVDYRLLPVTGMACEKIAPESQNLGLEVWIKRIVLRDQRPPVCKYIWKFFSSQSDFHFFFCFIIVSGMLHDLFKFRWSWAIRSCYRKIHVDVLRFVVLAWSWFNADVIQKWVGTFLSFAVKRPAANVGALNSRIFNLKTCIAAREKVLKKVPHLNSALSDQGSRCRKPPHFLMGNNVTELKIRSLTFR